MKIFLFILIILTAITAVIISWTLMWILIQPDGARGEQWKEGGLHDKLIFYLMGFTGVTSFLWVVYFYLYLF